MHKIEASISKVFDTCLMDKRKGEVKYANAQTQIFLLKNNAALYLYSKIVFIHKIGIPPIRKDFTLTTQ